MSKKENSSPLAEMTRDPAKYKFFVLMFCLFAAAVCLGLYWFPLKWIIAGIIGIGFIISILHRPLIGLYFLCFIIPFEFFQALGFLNFVKLIGWVIGISWVLYKMKTGLRFPRSHGWAWLATFSCVAIISIIWSSEKIAALIRLATLLQLLIFYLIIIDLADSKEKIWRALIVTSLGATIASIGAVCLTLIKGSLRLSFVAKVSPNAFVGFSAFILGIGLSLLLSGVPFIGKIGAMILILISLVTVILAGSMSGTLSIIVTILFVSLISIKAEAKRRTVVAFLLIIILFTVITAHFIYQSPWWNRIILAYSGPKLLLGGREIIWPAMFHRWLERPLLGWGFGESFDIKGFARAVRASGLSDPLGITSKQSAAPHNALLWAAVELGIIGFAILIAIYLVHLRRLFKVTRFLIIEDKLSVRICLALLSISIVVLALSMTEDIIFRRFFWLTLALIEAAWLTEAKVSGQDRSIA